MGRRKKPSSMMRDSIDKKDPFDFCWALLELSTNELQKEGSFKTLSPTDVKNILQALINSGIPQEDSGEKKASLDEIKKYLKG
jgi:hypothetical protein